VPKAQATHEERPNQRTNADDRGLACQISSTVAVSPTQVQPDRKLFRRRDPIPVCSLQLFRPTVPQAILSIPCLLDPLYSSRRVQLFHLRLLLLLLLREVRLFLLSLSLESRAR
jgi:hypothetical protein